MKIGWTRRNWLPLAVLLLILTGGSYIRIAELGQRDFNTDELYQYYVAQSLDQGEGPRLPSGRVYTRGIDVAHMVRASIDLFGQTPAAIRLPSALLGIAGLVLFAGILWALGGGWVAVWGTLLLAIYPEAIQQSRELRFYTYQMIFGLIALYTGWRALSHAGSKQTPEREALIRQWLWVLATAVALFLGLRAQVTTLSVAAGWGVCVAFAATADILARGWNGWRRSVPVQLVVAAAVAVLLVMLARPGILAEVYARSQSTPRWAIYGDLLHPLFYYYDLQANFPILLSFLPLIFILAILRRPRLGLYLATWFAVPMALHSFVFPWKGDRFVMLAFPALFGAAAIAAAWGAAALCELVRRASDRAGFGTRRREAVAYAVVAATALAVVVTTPAFSSARKTLDFEGASYRWTRTAGILESRPDLDGVPIGANFALHALYYWGRLDFVVRINGLERDTYRNEDGSWEVAYNPMGSPEYKTGRPVLTTPEAIREHFADAGSVLIGFDITSVGADNIEPSLYEVLSTEAEELCQGRCGQKRLYHWRFADPGDRFSRGAAETARISN